MLEFIILFMVYSYLGATLEHISYYFWGDKKKTLSNPIITGFPLYGAGAYLLITIQKLLKVTNPIIQFFIFGFALSLLEYAVGVYVGAGKDSYNGDHVAAWDYTNEPFNLHGVVSLRHFVSWGILGIIVVRIHPYLSEFVEKGISKTI